MALNFSEMTPAPTTMAQRTGAGRKAAVTLDENPWYAQGWLQNTYGEGVDALSLKVPATEAKGVQYLINKAAEALNLGASVQFRTLQGEELEWADILTGNKTPEGEDETVKGWVYKKVDEDGNKRVAERVKQVIVAWKAGDRKKKGERRS